MYTVYKYTVYMYMYTYDYRVAMETDLHLFLYFLIKYNTGNRINYNNFMANIFGSNFKGSGLSADHQMKDQTLVGLRHYSEK